MPGRFRLVINVIEAMRMISEHFDTRTRINMKLALDRVCRNRPGGEDHGFRKSVAENIIRCALAGRTGISQLVDAGERAMITTHGEREPA
ncbi:hypothetical protein [Bradyrhizobium sp. 18BD]